MEKAWAMVEKGQGLDRRTANPAPLFDGLARLGVTGKDMAAALRVSTASVSKWRNAHTAMPDEVKVFLTLMLADQVARTAEYGSRVDGDGVEQVLEQASADLARQERLNQGVAAAAVRDGARRYRLWWNARRNAAYLKPDDQMRDLGSRVAAGFR